MGVSAQQHRIAIGGYAQSRYQYGRYSVGQLPFISHIYADFNRFLKFVYIVSGADSNSYFDRVSGSYMKSSNFISIYFVMFLYIVVQAICTTLSVHIKNCYNDIFNHASKHTLPLYLNVLFNPTSAYFNGSHRVLINILFMLILTMNSNVCKNKVIILFRLFKLKSRIRSNLIGKFSYKYFYWITMLNLLLIIIISPSMVNPGPKQGPSGSEINNLKHLKVAYVNVGGFITTESMSGCLPVFKDIYKTN